MIVERVVIDNRGGGRSQRTLSNHAYQAWMEEWQARRAAGMDVCVLLAADNTHVVGFASWPCPGGRL